MANRTQGFWQSKVAYQVAFVVLVLLAWFSSTEWLAVSPLLLPDPLGVLLRLVQLLRSLEWLEPLGVTAAEVVSAFALSSILGIALSFVLSRSAWVVKTFDTLLNGINAVPAILFFPLFALLFGLGEGSKIALGFTISFFPIVINTTAAFGRVESIHLKAATCMGASKWQMLRHVLFPSAIPMILSGLRMGLTLAFLSVLGGETIASFNGLGHQIAESSQAMDAELMYAWIVFVIAVSFTLNTALTMLERIGGRAA
jgi:ABC-type nitrate/sulfonate/bicarbonate transport system permease component